MSWHRRYRIQFGYDGTHFHGSQIQPGVRTVQGELEVAAGRITGHPVQFAFAGRTDRGVHALGQVASGDLSWRSTPEQLARALQAVTPDDIVVQRVTLVNDRFHARFSARSREYRYLIWTGPIPPILSRGWVWHIRRALDCPAMNAAGAMLLGEHDFASFAGDGLGVPGDPEKRSTVRRVLDLDIAAIESAESNTFGESRLLAVRIVANGFLPRMVRNIVGTLSEIGLGTNYDVTQLLKAKDRRLAPAPAPAHGLTFWRVNYDDRDEMAGSEGAWSMMSGVRPEPRGGGNQT